MFTNFLDRNILLLPLSTGIMLVIVYDLLSGFCDYLYFVFSLIYVE
jgi:hypothetical protein